VDYGDVVYVFILVIEAAFENGFDTESLGAADVFADAVADHDGLVRGDIEFLQGVLIDTTVWFTKNGIGGILTERKELQEIQLLQVAVDDLGRRKGVGDNRQIQ